MRKGFLIEKINYGLSAIETFVSHQNYMGKTDENLDLEDFFCDYLNICDESSNFINLNKERNNYLGIDIGDKNTKVSYQITSDGSRTKVLNTIKKFESNELFKEFKELHILIIGKKPKYSTSFRVNGKYSFDKDRVVGIKELITNLSKLRDDQLEKLVALIEKAYPGIYSVYNSSSKPKIKITEQEVYPELEAPIKLRNNGYPNQALKLLNEIEKAKFDKVDDEFKYKLLANKGLCHLDLIDNRAAAELFIEALKYKPANDKSLGFAALGNFLIGNEETAEKLAKKALKLNPKSELAYNTLINIWSKSNDFDKKLKKIPEAIKNTTSISYQLGKKYQEIGNYEYSKKYFEGAIKQSDGKDADLKGALGTLILENFLNPFLYVTGQLDEHSKNEIRKAASLLEGAWKEIEGNDLRNSRTFWLVNLSSAKKALNDPDGALFDLKLASTIAPDELFTQRQYAINLFETGDMLDALKQIKKCKELDTSDDPMFDLFEAEIHFKSGEYKDCLKIIRENLNGVEFEGIQESTFLEIACLTSIGDIDKSITKCDELIGEERFKLRALINKAKLLKIKGNYDGYKSNLDEAISQINDNTSQENIHDIVNLLGAEERYSELINLLLRITNKEAYSELTKLLITAYFHIGKYKEALDLISTLKSKVGLQDYLIDIESMILFGIHNYEGAKKVCEEYLKKDPNHPNILMRLSIVLSKLEDIPALKDALKKIQNVDSQPFDFRFKYAFFLAQCGDLGKSLECAFNARRDNFRNGHAHLAYFQLFNQINLKDENDLVKINKVYFDTTVYLVKKSNNQTQIKTLLQISNPKHERGELGLADSLTKELISKKIGDFVILDNNESYKVQEITSKYVGAIRESLQLLESEYKNISGFESFKIKERKEGEPRDFKEDFAPIYEQMEEDESFHKLIEDKYQSGSIPIGTFASFTSKNFIRVWIHLAHTKHLGIHHYGSDQESISGIGLIRSGKSIVFTLSSLLSIYHVAKDEIQKLSSRKFIAQSSIDTIDELIQECKFSIDRGGHLVIVKSGDQIFKQEVTIDDLQKTVDHYADFKKWCSKNFEVIHNIKEAELDQKEKDKQDQMFGESFIDSIHISDLNDALIADDDSIFRRLVNEEFKIPGIGAYSLVKYWLEVGAINIIRFHEILYDLANLNYKNIPCSRDFLIYVTEKLNFQLGSPLTDLLEEFGSEFFEMRTSINILVLYLKEISLVKTQITLEKFADFIIPIIMRRRNFIQAKAHFVNSLLIHFKYLELQRLSILQIWNQYETI